MNQNQGNNFETTTHTKAPKRARSFDFPWGPSLELKIYPLHAVKKWENAIACSTMIPPKHLTEEMWIGETWEQQRKSMGKITRKIGVISAMRTWISHRYACTWDEEPCGMIGIEALSNEQWESVNWQVIRNQKYLTVLQKNAALSIFLLI